MHWRLASAALNVSFQKYLASNCEHAFFLAVLIFSQTVSLCFSH